MRTRVTLTTRQLNRALLARQLLLKRKRVSVRTAIHAAGGLQSQEPRDPFVALWSRIRSFNARHLLDAARNREIVRGSFLRATIHTTTSDDYAAFRLLLQPVIHRELALRREFGGGFEMKKLGHAHLVGSERDQADPREAPAAIDGLQGRIGARLFDLAGAPRPDAETPAPVRFLPEYDNVFLSHADRGRIMHPAHGRHFTQAGNGRRLRTVLIDGFVRAGWTATRRGTRAAIEVRAFERLSKAVVAELSEEAEALLRFTEPDAAEFAVDVVKQVAR